MRNTPYTPRADRAAARWLAVLISLLVILLAGCQPQTTTVVETVIVEGTPQVVEVPAEAPYAPPSRGDNSTSTAALVTDDRNAIAQIADMVVPYDRMIIRDARITFRVDNPSLARDEIEGVVADLASQGGYIVSSTERANEGDEPPTVSMVIRVPFREFDNVMNRLESMAVKIEERYEDAKDVTEEYVDLQGRLEAMQRGRDRLLEILDDASSVANVITIEDEITRREAEIEATQARIRFLSQSSATSRITISILPMVVEKPKPEPQAWSLAAVYERSQDALEKKMQGWAESLVYLLVVQSPSLVLYAVVLTFLYRVWRRWFQKPLPTPMD